MAERAPSSSPLALASRSLATKAPMKASAAPMESSNEYACRGSTRCVPPFCGKKWGSSKAERRPVVSSYPEERRGSSYKPEERRGSSYKPMEPEERRDSSYKPMDPEERPALDSSCTKRRPLRRCGGGTSPTTGGVANLNDESQPPSARSRSKWPARKVITTVSSLGQRCSIISAASSACLSVHSSCQPSGQLGSTPRSKLGASTSVRVRSSRKRVGVRQRVGQRV